MKRSSVVAILSALQLVVQELMLAAEQPNFSVPEHKKICRLYDALGTARHDIENNDTDLPEVV